MLIYNRDIASSVNLRRVVLRFFAVCSVVSLSFVSTQLYAQGECEIVPPNTDVNGDGYVDQYVSPEAKIRNTEIDCTEHNIQANSILRNSRVFGFITIGSGARVIRSSMAFESSALGWSRVVDSYVDGVGTVVGEHSIVTNNSSITRNTVLANNVKVSDSQIDESQVGADSFIRSAQLTGVKLENNVRVRGASIVSNGAGFGATVIRSGTRVRVGASILGPIDVGENSIIGKNVDISGFKFIGSNFRIGRDSVIAFGGDLLGDIRIGQRVNIGAEPDIGNRVTIGNDTVIDFGILTGSDVVVQRNVTIGANVFLGNMAVVRNGASLGNSVEVNEGANVGKGAVVGAGAIIGSNAIVRGGANVPANFTVQPDTVFPDDYNQ